ncbi:hypothetical protein Spb1_31540 [Planctopirus ephydatiae]|uniref:Uncharacterized protein n=1 Tax=Planctopirus ephydatiae TaxID=2528019 RepID=A0A518GRQ0_9PLAN|nr:hypothetical protein Spb1_31540 [Planctopirus ephydatiae]
MQYTQKHADSDMMNASGRTRAAKVAETSPNPDNLHSCKGSDQRLTFFKSLRT